MRADLPVRSAFPVSTQQRALVCSTEMRAPRTRQNTLEVCLSWRAQRCPNADLAAAVLQPAATALVRAFTLGYVLRDNQPAPPDPK